MRRTPTTTTSSWRVATSWGTITSPSGARRYRSVESNRWNLWTKQRVMKKIMIFILRNEITELGMRLDEKLSRGEILKWRAKATKKPVDLVHIINRLADCSQLITYNFKLFSILRYCSGTFLHLSKAVTKGVDSFNRGAAVGSLQSSPDRSRIRKTKNFSGCFFS